MRFYRLLNMYNEPNLNPQLYAPAASPPAANVMDALISTTAPRSRSPRSIIVLAREHIGDLVCTIPALRSLRQLYPHARIVVELGERATCVLENCPYVDELILRPRHQGLRGKARFIRELRRRRFDLGVILDDSADMPLFLWLGNVTRRVGLARKKRFVHLLTDPVPYDFETHEMIDNFRNVVAHLGADISDPVPELAITAAEVDAVDRMLAAAGVTATDTLVALNPSASTQPRHWPPERFAELGARLSTLPGVRLLLTGGPGDQRLVEDILSRMQTPPIVVMGVTVLQLAETLRRSTLLVSGDTGPMHIACAVGTPVVALFGPSKPPISGPGYVDGNIVIQNKTEPCSGCSWEQCVHANRCMRTISVAEVADAVTDKLAERTSLLTAGSGRG